MKSIYFYQTDIGKVAITADEKALTHMCLNPLDIPQDAVLAETELIKEAGRQLQYYLSGRLKSFTLPLAPAGSEFMQQVWESLQTIPYGETWSYKELAQSIGNPLASRAVGMANHRNPIPIFIPCHRVIGSNGKLTGYRGGLQIKAYLLDLEKQFRAS